MTPLERRQAQAERAERLARLVAPENEVETMDTICAHVAEGGVLSDLCATWDIPFGLISAWVSRDNVRRSRYDKAIGDCYDWARDKVMREVRRLALVDIRDLFNEAGELKEISELTEDQAAAIASVEIDELLAGKGPMRGVVGHRKKIKFWSKPDAIKLLGKQLGLFQEKVELNAGASLLDVIEASRHPKDV